jgi:hypothetical protein
MTLPGFPLKNIEIHGFLIMNILIKEKFNELSQAVL